jgi:hypothetical protein
MHDVPRQKLQAIVDRYGEAIVDDVRRSRALLLDLCGAYRREIFVLTTAQEEQVPNDLLEMEGRVPTSVLVAQLTRRLMDNRALTEDAARWAVESWAEALGVGVSVGDLTQPNQTSSVKRHPTSAESVVDRTQREAGGVGRRPHPTGDRSTFAEGDRSTFAEGDHSTFAEGDRSTFAEGDRSTFAEGLPTEAKGAPRRASFASRCEIEVLGRPEADPDAEWQRLGMTPGDVPVPPDYVLGLRLLDLGDQNLRGWIAALDHPSDIVWMDTDRLAVTEADLIAIGTLSHLMRLDVKHGMAITDAGLRPLRGLRALRHLSLFWSKITDAGLTQMAAHRHLMQLDLRESKHVTGKGFASLASLPELRNLDCTGWAQFTDAGLESLSGLRTLHKLNLSRCPQITHRGLAHLRALTALTYLDLSGNPQIDDRAVAQLRPLRALTSLTLSHTAITNDGLAHIRELSNLIYLDLSGCTSITNRGLRHLRQLSYLVYLNLTGCPRINARGINRLEQPGLFILHPEV